MSDINQVCITGYLGQDPAIRYFESGNRVANFSVAISEYAGNGKNITTWVDCRVWNQQADFVGEYGKKGSLVVLNGRLAVDSYKTQEGLTRTKTYINVNEIKLIDKK